MFLRYSATQQINDCIIESTSFNDTINWEELKKGYGLTKYESNDFLYLKKDYIDIMVHRRSHSTKYHTWGFE